MRSFCATTITRGSVSNTPVPAGGGTAPANALAARPIIFARFPRATASAPARAAAVSSASICVFSDSYVASSFVRFQR